MEKVIRFLGALAAHLIAAQTAARQPHSRPLASAGALVLSLTACGNVEGLRSEDIYGLTPNPQVWLAGLITNARSGAPLADVSIQVEGRSTNSDRNGAYRLEGLGVIEAAGSASAHGFQVYAMTLNLRPGANARDIALEPQECGRWSCGSGEFCDEANGMCVQGATLSGSVVNDCTGAAIDARVTIGGWSTCSGGQSSQGSGKAYVELRDLQPGGPQTLAVGKTNYQAYSTDLTLQPGFNTFGTVRLVPVGGCSATQPEYVACTCTTTNCQ